MIDRSRFRGTGVAVITPFKAGEIDFPALGQIIEYLINGKVEYLICLGTTGEATSLSESETQQVLEFFIEKNAGRLPLIFGPFGMNNTAELIRKIKSFDLTGVDAIMSSSPAYVKPTQEGLYRHYMCIADTSPLPVLIYDVPSRTACGISADTTLRLSNDHSNFLGIKEASADMMMLSTLIKNRPDDFLIISGDDNTAFPTMALGADGLISVLGNAFPFEMSQMIRHGLADEFQMGARLHLQMLDIHKYIYCEGNPTGIKMTMSQLGFCSSEVRLPLVKMSDESAHKMEQVIEKSGLRSPVTTH